MVRTTYKIFLAILIILALGVNGYTVTHNDISDPLCGPKCLLKVCALKNITSNLEEICALSGYSAEHGTSMLGLFRAARKKGLNVVPLKMKFHELTSIDDPFIAFVDGNHFMIVHNIKDDYVVVQNPPQSPFPQSKHVFTSRWNGEVLVFSDTIIKQAESQMVSLDAALNGSHISFSGTSYDFGTVDEGSKLSKTFTFTNIGKEPLEIVTRSTCTCTVIVLAEKEIQPGGNGKIKIEYDTTGKKGNITQKIYVKTNDPVNTSTILSIKAAVQSHIKVVPGRIWLDRIAPNEKIKREIQIFDSGDGKLTIESIDSPEEIVTEVLPERTGNIRILPVTMIFTSGNDPGEFQKSFTIHTNDKKHPEITVPVSGIVLSDIKVFPPSVFINGIEPGTTIVKEIIITSRKGEKFKNIFLKPSSPYITTEVVPLENASTFKVKTTFHAPHDEIVLREKIPIFIDDTDQPAIEVMLFAQVKKKHN